MNELLILELESFNHLGPFFDALFLDIDLMTKQLYLLLIMLCGMVVDLLKIDALLGRIFRLLLSLLVDLNFKVIEVVHFRLDVSKQLCKSIFV